MSRLRVPLLLVALLALGAPPASAQDFTVATAGEFATALAAADGNGQDDVITFAPGASVISQAGGWAYNVGSSDADRNLLIKGSGRAIQSTAAATVLNVVNAGGQGRVTLEDLIVGTNASATIGLDANAPMTLRNVTISGPMAAISTGLYVSRAFDATGVTVATQSQQGILVQSSPAATLKDTTLTKATSRQVLVYGQAEFDGLSTSQPTGPSTSGIESSGPQAVVTARRVRIAGAGTAVHAAFSSSATVTDGLITALSPGGRALAADDNGNPAAHTSSITAERLTIVGTDDANQWVAVADGGSVSEADKMQIVLRDSIASAIPNGLQCEEGNAQSADSVKAERSNLPPASADVDACIDFLFPGVTRTAVTSVDPQFVNAAGGDYHLRPGSPLIDASLAEGQLLGIPATDLDGAPRLNDGDGDCLKELDLGAYETQAPIAAACLPPATPAGGAGAPVPAAAADRIAPTISGLRVAKAIRRSATAPVTIRFGLSEAATVRLTFAKARGRRFVPVKGAITLKLKPGSQKVRFAGRLSKLRRLATGSYRLTITATDGAGNRSRAQRAGFRLTG